MSEKKYQHPMIFRCGGCKTEHRPKKGTWPEQSAEVGALGWKIVYREGGVNYGYVLRCGGCAKALAAAA